MKVTPFYIDALKVGDPKHLFFIAGPCVVESRELVLRTAEKLKHAAVRVGVGIIFKSSYKKANRTSSTSFTGIGDERALKILREVKERLDVPVLTDVHLPVEAELAAEYVDVLQIPAFLSRQTELLQAAGKTGKAVNIKKGQFMAPSDMSKAAAKVLETGNSRVMLTERGTSFGYHNLVVDYRALPIMSETGLPVVFDATHSVQLPSAGNGVSSGERRFIPALARAAVAVGISGIFMEVHPDPSRAKSDAATQVPLKHFEQLARELKALFELSSTFKTKLD
ncbi:MAG: 3-deoxy-8-phosphooctulonate synthase [Candidatus Thermochlorobacter sp.]